MKKEFRVHSDGLRLYFTKMEKKLEGLEEGDVIHIKDYDIIKAKWNHINKAANESEEGE